MNIIDVYKNNMKPLLLKINISRHEFHRQYNNKHILILEINTTFLSKKTIVSIASGSLIFYKNIKFYNDKHCIIFSGQYIGSLVNSDTIILHFNECEDILYRPLEKNNE